MSPELCPVLCANALFFEHLFWSSRSRVNSELYVFYLVNKAREQSVLVNKMDLNHSSTQNCVERQVWTFPSNISLEPKSLPALCDQYVCDRTWNKIAMLAILTTKLSAMTWP